MKADLYNKEAEKIGTVELPERIFGRRWSAQLVHQALVAQTSNSRESLAHAKGRHEVSGGGRKPWAQKGTGRARHSSIRSPIWRGGGVAHGPVKDKDFSQKINKRQRQAALFSLLSRKLKDGELKIVDSLDIEAPKTKHVHSLLSKLANDGKKKPKISALVVPGADNKSIYPATRNIDKAKSLSPAALNIYDLLRYKYAIIDKSAVELIDKTYSVAK